MEELQTWVCGPALQSELAKVVEAAMPGWDNLIHCTPAFRNSSIIMQLLCCAAAVRRPSNVRLPALVDVSHLSAESSGRSVSKLMSSIIVPSNVEIGFSLGGDILSLKLRGTGPGRF